MNIASLQDDIENAKKEWELGRLKALKEEEERRLEVEEDEMLFTYTRDDAFNQVKKTKKVKATTAKAKTPTPGRVASARKRPVKKKDENYVIDEDKRRSDQGLAGVNVVTPKTSRPVGRPPKNKTPKVTPKSAKGKKVTKIDVESIDVDDTPKPVKAKRQSKAQKISEEEQAQTSKIVSKILAQANQKAAAKISAAQEQITYSQQLLAQSQKSEFTKAQLASAIQKVQQVPNMAKPATVNPQLLSPSQLQHLKNIISNAHRNITPGQTLQQQIQGQFLTSPVKSVPGTSGQQLFFQTSPSQQGQFVLSPNSQILTQQIQQGGQTVVQPSLVQVQGRGAVGAPTLLQVQSSQPGGAPSIVQIQQPQNLPAFVQIQTSQMGTSQFVQVQGTQPGARMVQAPKYTTPTSQVVQFQTSPSALLAQIQASRVHGSQRNPTAVPQKTHPTIVQAGQQGTQLVIPPNIVKQAPVRTSQFPSYSTTTPSIINVQNLPQQSTKLTTNKTQYATVQDIQLVMTNAGGSLTTPAIQQAKVGPPQTIQVVASQAAMSGGSVQQVKQAPQTIQQIKQAPQTIQQVITQNSAGQPVVQFIRMAGSQAVTPNLDTSSASRPPSGQQGVVYLQLAGGKAIPVSLANSQMSLPIVKPEKPIGQAVQSSGVRNVMPTIVVTQGGAIQVANGPIVAGKVSAPASRFQVAGNVAQRPSLRSPLPASARPAIATVGMVARQSMSDSPSTVPPPWNNPNLVIRTRRAAVQSKPGVENGIVVKSPPETIDINHIPSANVDNKNGCTTPQENG